MVNIIRLATLHDLDRLFYVEKMAFSSTHYHRLSRRQYRYLLTKGHAHVWVVEQGNEVVGSMVLLYRRQATYARLYSLAILPDYQGQGLGTELIDHAIKSSRQKPFTHLRQEVRADNTRLIKRYLQQGFEQVGRVENYYPDGQSCLKLKKEL